MISIELEYRPFAFIPWTRTIERRLPSRWSEMNHVQICAIPGLQEGKLNDQKLLQIFLGLRKSIAKRIDSYQAFCITRHLKYVSKAEPLGSFIIPKIAGFRAPGPRLKGITFGAFMFGDTYFSGYQKGNMNDLDRFIACFYGKKCGFSDRLIEKNAWIISKQDIAIRKAIAINYALIREWLAVVYPYVFMKNEEPEINNGWIAVFDMLVKDDLGNQDKYSELPASTVLRHLNNMNRNYYKYGGKV